MTKLLEHLRALGTEQANSPGISGEEPVASTSYSIESLLNALKNEDTSLGVKVEQMEKESIGIMVEKRKAYGGRTYAVAGLHSAVSQVMHKGERLKGLVLHPNPEDGFKLSPVEMKNSKEVRDTLVDLLNYCRLTMVEFEK